jgi:hypothetical protein
MSATNSLQDLIVGQIAIGSQTQGWSSLLDSAATGVYQNSSSATWTDANARIIYDQYNEPAISTVSDTWNTDPETTLISDPDYGIAAVNGVLVVRNSLQLQSFGGTTAATINVDGSAYFAGGVTVDSAGDLCLSTTGGGIKDASGSIGATGQTLTTSGTGYVNWGYLFYANSSPMTDGSSNLYNSSGNKLADASYIYFPNGNYPLASGAGEIFYNGGAPLVDYGGFLNYPSGNGVLATGTLLNYPENGNTLASNTQICYPNGNPLADNGGNLYSSYGNVLSDSNGILYPVAAPTGSAPAYVLGGLYFDTTLNKLRVGGAAAWETVTSV